MTEIGRSTPAAVGAVVLVHGAVQAMCAHERFLIGAKQVETVQAMNEAARLVLEVLFIFRRWIDPIALQELKQYSNGVVKALRPVMNADIALKYFKEYRRSLAEEDEKDALKQHIDRLTAVRLQRRQKMMGAIEEFHLKRLSRDIDAFIVVPEIRPENQHPTLIELAEPIIQTCLRDMFTSQDELNVCSLRNPVPKLYKVTKRLKLALDVFQPIFLNTSRKMVKRVGECYQMLIDIHNCSVLLEHVDRMCRTSRKTHRNIPFTKSLERIHQHLSLQLAERHAELKILINDSEYQQLRAVCTEMILGNRSASYS